MYRHPTPRMLPLILALALAGCGGETPEQHFQKGKDLLAKGDRQGAILELKSTLQAQPANAQARLLLGQAHLANEAYAEAEKELGQAREHGAPEEQAVPLLAKALLAAGKAQQVFDLGIPTHKYGPQSRASLYASRAAALFALGKEDQANQAIAAAEEADANHPELLLFKARLALGKQDKPKAMQFLDAALKQDAKFNDALYLKAAILLLDGKSDAAIQAMQQITANDARDYHAHLAVADLQTRAGRIEDAENSLSAAEKIAPGVPMVKYNRSLFELKRGKYKEAKDGLAQVLKAMPDHPQANLAYAIVSLELGNYEQCLQSARKTLALDSHNPTAMRIVAVALLKAGDAKGALAALSPLLKSDADNPDLLALAAEIHVHNKDYDKAMNYLDRAVSLDPENSALKLQRATNLLAKGRHGAAQADLEKAARHSEKAGQADLALVMLHLKGKAYDKALQAIADLEKKLPDNPLVHNLRAGALFGKQDQAGARQALERALAIKPDFLPAALNLARLEIQERKPKAARKHLEALLAKDNGNVQAMLALAEIAASERKEGEYVSWLEKAVKADPKAIQAHAGLVNHHLSRKENAKALSQAKRAALANPDDQATQTLLANTQLATGDTSAALDTFARMSRHAPQSPHILLRLALAQMASKQLDDARESLAKALRIRPDYLEAQDGLLTLEMAARNPEAALALARQMQKQHPASPIGFDREGDIELSRKRHAQALKAYDQALARGAGASGVVKLHRATVLSGDPRGADQRLSAWLKQNPKDVPVRAYAAEYFMHANRNREATALYEEVLRLTPQSVPVLNNLANLYQGARDARAVPTAEQALKLAPGHAGVLDTLGWILLEQGNLPRATELLAKAAAKAPKTGTIRYHYGVALARGGKRHEARKELEAAIAGDQKFPERDDAKRLLTGL